MPVIQSDFSIGIERIENGWLVELSDHEDAAEKVIMCPTVKKLKTVLTQSVKRLCRSLEELETEENGENKP